MEIKTVAVLGAGAVGSYFIAGLQKKLKESLWVIADGERKERLRTDGIVINEKQYELNVKEPKEAHGVDLLLVTVKYLALHEALNDIEQIVDQHTIVLSVLNGVDSEKIIEAKIGPNHVVHSMIKIASERNENNISFDEEKTLGLFFGETSKNNDTPRMKALAQLFETSKVRYTISNDIIRDLWLKYALNISKNIPQAIIGCGLGAYEDSTHVATLSKKLRDEVVAVAAKKGIDIAYDDFASSSNGTLDPRARFSTLQDLDYRRHTEIDTFCGAMIRMGAQLEVPTPYNEFAYHVIKALEEKNDGKFEYE